MEAEVKYAKMTNPIMKVDFVDCAEHVGLARSTLGNSVPSSPEYLLTRRH